MDAAVKITLLTADGQAMERTSDDLTWITDWTGFNFPLDVREGETLVVEALSDDARMALWHEFKREYLRG